MIFMNLKKDFLFIVNGEIYQTNSFVANIFKSKNSKEKVNTSYYEINTKHQSADQIPIESYRTKKHAPPSHFSHCCLLRGTLWPGLGAPLGQIREAPARKAVWSVAGDRRIHSWRSKRPKRPQDIRQLSPLLHQLTFWPLLDERWWESSLDCPIHAQTGPSCPLWWALY